MQTYDIGKFFETFPHAVKAISEMDMEKSIYLPTPPDQLGQLKLNAYRYMMALERMLAPFAPTPNVL